MLLAEIDPVQIIIIVIAMGAGFVQWLWGLIKQGQEEAARRQGSPLTPEEREAREQAWKQQVQTPGKPARPSPKTPPPVQDPWATVRDVFEQIKEEARKAQNPEPPPIPQRPAQQPARQRQRPGTVRADLRPVPTPPPVPADPFPAAPVKQAPVAVTPPVSFAAAPTPPRYTPPALQPLSRPNQDLQALHQLLHTPASLRQAVLLREILGPPKALQSSGDSAF